MSPLGIGALTFVSLFGGAMIAMAVGGRLPDDHWRAESKEVVKLGIGLIATMAALVLGLLIASAKGVYDTKNTEVQAIAADIITLDRILKHYGAETDDVRKLIRTLVEMRLRRTWPEVGVGRVDLPETMPVIERVQDELFLLRPQTDAQRALQANALEVSGDIAHMRWLTFEHTGSSIPTAFLVVVVCWIAVIFASFGLYAPRNATVVGMLLICALSVAAGIVLILEMDAPLHGVLKISPEPLRYALQNLGR